MDFRDIQSHPDICGNCFRRVRWSYERNFAVDWYHVNGDWELWLRQVELPPERYTVHENTVDVPKVEVSKGTRKTCKCGFPAGEQLRPLPKKLFFSFAENIVERAEEFGITMDEETFYDNLYELKSDPDNQFADDRLFKRCYNEAVTTDDEGRIPRSSTA